METAAKDLNEIVRRVFKNNEHKNGIGTEIFETLEQQEILIRNSGYDPAHILVYHQQIEDLRRLLIDALIEGINILTEDKGPVYGIDKLLSTMAEVRNANSKLEFIAIIHKCKESLTELKLE